MSSQDDRLDRLRAAQRRLARALADPATKTTMIPQLTGQLIAVERQLDRLFGRQQIEDSLPTAETVCLVDLLGYAHWLRGQVPARRRQAPNEYVEGRNAIFESWRDAGFELSPRSDIAVDDWIAENRDRLIECTQPEKETTE